MIKSLLKKYSFFLIMLLLLIGIIFLNKDLGIKSLAITFSSIKQMISIVPPVMLLLVWMYGFKETMMKYMGIILG